MTETPQPSQNDSPAHGAMMRRLLGGGDTLYGLGLQDVLTAIAQDDPLVLHHTLQNQQDACRDLRVELSLYAFVLVMANVIIIGAASSLLHLQREASLDLLLYLGLLVSLGVFAWLWRKHRIDHPNYGWESLKTLDFSARQLRCQGALFGKAPDQRTSLYAFDELGLVCYVDSHWEQGSTIELALASRAEIKAAKYPAECRFFCHLYSVNPPSAEGSGHTKHEITDRIPEELWTVAQALIARSGIAFFDFVSAPEQRKIRERKRVAVAKQGGN